MKFAYGFSTCIHLNILIIYIKDPNFKSLLILFLLNLFLSSIIKGLCSYFYVIFYTAVGRQDVLWNGPVRPSVRPSTIACERDILKTAYRIDFTF